MKEYSTRPHNKRKKNSKNGRCCYKKYGVTCGAHAAGLVDGHGLCKLHYSEKLRLEKRYQNLENKI